MDKEKIKIIDKKGFHYLVEFQYTPHHGLVFAYYEDRIIGNVEYGRITQPLGDNDRDWERYDELFLEFTERSKIDLIPKCEEHFNNQYNKHIVT